MNSVDLPFYEHAWFHLGLFGCEVCDKPFEMVMEQRGDETLDDAAARFAPLPRLAGWHLVLSETWTNCDLRLYKCYCPACYNTVKGSKI